ncbi:MAG: sigma-54-dependent Fis family transcriptional regulator [Planctomycetaceae bacterium]|nr:sigma-54-dependent Fis family transcriptional regulator [Planctomycetaceae bacterium]
MDWIEIDSLQHATEQSLVSGLIGTSAPMQEVYRMTRKAAGSQASVLLIGETGTGKELIAKALHLMSNRESGPLVKVNCGALSESLLESELFGHVRGSFTGAVANRTGRFEAAHTGSIFLDEINSTSLQLQIKLLRVLQEREFERVGDTQTVQVDVRVIAASNRDLWSLVKRNEFREDLYWRLNVVPIQIPPLRARPGDIPSLVRFFAKHYADANQVVIHRISAEALEALQAYNWPGNVRELQNYIERAIILSDDDTISRQHLPPHLFDAEVAALMTAPLLGADAKELDDIELSELVKHVVQRGLQVADPADAELHSQVIDQFEKELLNQVLSRCGGVQTKAATLLGINRNTLYKKLKQFGLEQADQGDEKEA